MEGPLIAAFGAIVAIAIAAAVAAMRARWHPARIIAASALPGAIFGVFVAAGSDGRALGFVAVAAVASGVAGAVGTYVGINRRK